MKFICQSSATIVNFFADFKGSWKIIVNCFNSNSKKVLIALLVVLGIIVSNRITLTNVLNTQAYAEVPTIEEQEVVTPEPVDPIKIEAEYVAKVLYGTAQLNSAHGQKMVVWCIINRVENQNYPDSIKDVCQQKDQWMGYSDNNPVMRDLYDLSYEILSNWHNGGYRDISPDFIFMKWSPDQICLKTEFEETKSCRFIYE